MAEELRLTLGALRSAMQLTLHTRHALRIWHGRARSAERAAIIGLNGFLAIMNTMKRGAEQDDPYSDWWIIKLEEKLSDSKTRLQALREEVDQVLTRIPAAVTFGENLNVQAVKLPLFIGSQLGFLALYLLADYDEFARRLLLAHHIALMDRHTMERWLDEGAHLLRSTFALAQKYRYTGACRDDFAANNAVARAAREKLGELPQDVLEGTRRSPFAPPIIKRSPSLTRDSSDIAPPLDEAASSEVPIPVDESATD